MNYDNLRHEWRAWDSGRRVACVHDCGRVIAVAAVRHTDMGMEVGPPAVSRLCPTRVTAALQAAEERAEKAEAMLRRLEWAYDYPHDKGYCPVCRRHRHQARVGSAPHAPNCELAALLGETP